MPVVCSALEVVFVDLAQWSQELIDLFPLKILHVECRIGDKAIVLLIWTLCDPTVFVLALH